MKHDLENRLKEIIREEIRTIVDEGNGKFGRILDIENFDPVDPEVYVTGFGTMARSVLRNDIAKRLVSLAKTANQAASGDTGSFDKFKVLESELGERSQIMQLIKAEVEIAEQLEALRTQGGRRTTPIPKQF